MWVGTKWTAAAALILAMPAFAAPAEKTVSIKDPAGFAATLREMGYKPEELQKGTKMPAFTVTLGDQPTRFTFGGCTNRLDCKYLYLSSSYNDVPNPPAEWLNKMNDNFDMIKVSTDADKDLYFSATHVIEGVPRSTLKMILDMWISDANALAQEAVTAKLNKGK
jgi:Putative bacterial sensory transduction regulator